MLKLLITAFGLLGNHVTDADGNSAGNYPKRLNPVENLKNSLIIPENYSTFKIINSSIQNLGPVGIEL